MLEGRGRAIEWMMTNKHMSPESLSEADWIQIADLLFAYKERQHHAPATPATPIQLNTEQEKCVKIWAADDRCWTTQETVEFNLRTFARKILGEVAEAAPTTALPDHFKPDPDDDPRSAGLCGVHGDYNGRFMRCPVCHPAGQGRKP